MIHRLQRSFRKIANVILISRANIILVKKSKEMYFESYRLLSDLLYGRYGKRDQTL